MIQKCFRGYFSRKKAMISGLQLEKYPYIYFLQEQKQRIFMVVRRLYKKQKKEFNEQEVEAAMFLPAKEILTLRYPTVS
jgi:hypothetical protein